MTAGTSFSSCPGARRGVKGRGERECGGRVRQSSVWGSTWRCRAWHCHIRHQEPGTCAMHVSGRNWRLPLLTLQDLGPFPVLPQGSRGTRSRSRAGAALKTPVRGHGSQDLVLVLQPNPCTCACVLPPDPVWGIGGSCFYGPFLGNGARRGCFGWRFTRDWEEAGPLNPIPKQTAQRAGSALHKEKGDGEGEAREEALLQEH